MAPQQDGNSPHLMVVSQRTRKDLLIIWVGSCNASTCISLIQTSYLAPEYALDEVLDPASDMYSVGCLIYAVHCKGNPPFKNHGSLGGLRENAGKPLQGMERLDQDLRSNSSISL